jgi:phosphatidate phosphatase APP1
VLTRTDALNLEADSAAQVSAWLFGINCLVTGSGKRIDVAPGTVSHERRYSVLAGESKRTGAPPRSSSNDHISSSTTLASVVPSTPRPSYVPMTAEDRLSDEFPFTEYYVDNRGVCTYFTFNCHTDRSLTCRLMLVM